jgi:hypothetical protein
MSEYVRLQPRRAKKLAETIYTDRGLRLSPAARVTNAKWFWPAMIALPVGAFAIVFFW